MNASHDFLARLRSETAGIHHQLEQLPISSSLLSDTVTVQDLGVYLSAMLPVHLETENDLFPQLETVFPDLEYRRKAALIVEGLERLGFEPIAEVPSYLDEAWRPDPAFNAGMLYVTEGSTLGGKVILKHLLQAGDPRLTAGAAFFNAYGEHTGSRWKSFLEAFTRYAQQVDDAGRDAIVDGAVYGFGRIALLFEQMPQVSYEDQ